MPRTGHPPSIAAAHYPLLVKLTHAQPYSSQAELARAFLAETGITTHPDTFAKALKLAGITRVKQRAKGSFQSPEPRKSYGYNETHRRQLPEQRYPSCLTDAAARVSALGHCGRRETVAQALLTQRECESAHTANGRSALFAGRRYRRPARGASHALTPAIKPNAVARTSNVTTGVQLTLSSISRGISAARQANPPRRKCPLADET